MVQRILVAGRHPRWIKQSHDSFSDPVAVLMSL
jgi:hypothetical protein